MSVYKPCDIRGNAATELSPELYEAWGRTLGRQLAPGTPFVVGGDIRGSTPVFLAALVEGLLQAGMNVTNLGQLPTPMIYFAKRLHEFDGCAIVTASHNPASVNGLKWMVGQRPPAPEDVAVLERGVQEVAGCDRVRGSLCNVDIEPEYLPWLRTKFQGTLQSSLHVVLDPMQGCWAERAARYLQTVFPQCTFLAIRNAAEPSFGGCTPDCSRPHELRELQAAVRDRHAHLGIAFDGDGDRVAFVDDGGTPFSAEEATWMLLHSFGRQLNGSRFVYDQKFSDRIAEAAQHLGAEPLVERSGHAFIRTRMQDANAIFGAEISGHYFYGDLNGGDDGLYTACRAIAYLSSRDCTMSACRRECPRVFISPDLRVALPPEVQTAIVARIREHWAQYPQLSIDGVRVNLPDGWALVRPSVTEAALTFRFEGHTRVALQAIMHEFAAVLPEVGKAFDSTPA